MITKLLTLDLQWYTDPGHGWLRVPLQAVIDVGVAGRISSCSYVSTAYPDGLSKETEYLDDMFSKCHGLGDLQDRHEVNIPGYGDDGRWGVAAAVLLSFDHDRQVLCGFESGKAVKWAGRTDSSDGPSSRSASMISCRRSRL